MIRRLLVVPLAALLTGCGYNTIQTLDERAQGYQSQIEVQLQRRADLIGNLVETVKGYAQHEQSVLVGVAEARAQVGRAIQGGDAEQMAAANTAMTGALGRLIAVVESNPNLKADANFRALQDELTGTENRIATARGDYNGAVNEYNAYIRRFPQVITAKVTGAGPRKYFTAAPGTTEAPRVDFGTGAKQAPPAGKTP
jgi:LemA protein